jgi:hypothetical protein
MNWAMAAGALGFAGIVMMTAGVCISLTDGVTTSGVIFPMGAGMLFLAERIYRR